MWGIGLSAQDVQGLGFKMYRVGGERGYWSN